MHRGRSVGRRRFAGTASWLELPGLSLVESQLALAALGDLCAGSRTSVPNSARRLRRVRATLLPRVS